MTEETKIKETVENNPTPEPGKKTADMFFETTAKEARVILDAFCISLMPIAVIASSVFPRKPHDLACATVRQEIKKGLNLHGEDAVEELFQQDQSNANFYFGNLNQKLDLFLKDADGGRIRMKKIASNLLTAKAQITFEISIGNAVKLEKVVALAALTMSHGVPINVLHQLGIEDEDINEMYEFAKKFLDETNWLGIKLMKT